MFEALRWFVRSFGPYALGILVGVFFAYLFTQFFTGTKVPTSYEQWLALVTEAAQEVRNMGESPLSPPPPPPAKERSKPVHATPVATAVPAMPPAPAPKVEPVPVAMPIPTPPVVAAVPVQEVAKAPTPVMVAEVKPAAPVIQNTEKPVAEKKEPPAANGTSSQDNVMSCGTPPRQPGPDLSQYLACRWKENCLNRLAQARYMIEQGRMRCPTDGYNAQACQAYYQALEDRYHPAMCER